MTEHNISKRYLIDAVVERFPNASEVHGWGVDSAEVELPNGWAIITREEMTTYAFGIYTDEVWRESDGDPVSLSSVPADPAIVVEILDTLTSSAEGVDPLAWAVQWMDDALADGRIPDPERAARDRYSRLVRAIGPGFHPDTAGADYNSLPDGIEPEIVDEIVEVALAAKVDVHGLGLDLIIELADGVAE